MKHADHWFYVPASTTQFVTFPADEAIHAAKVLRLQSGDGIQWLDGKGGRFTGRITSLDKRSLAVEVISSTRDVQASPTVLAVGQLHDASRLEWLVEKATELGVTELILLATSRVERTRYKMSRLQAKVISAVKQSGRAWVPDIRELSFAEALTAYNDFDECFLAHCYPEPDRIDFWKAVPVEKSACLFIGPEGDFSKEEVQQAKTAGFVPISLGNARLRTETAGLAGLVRLRNLMA